MCSMPQKQPPPNIAVSVLGAGGAGWAELDGGTLELSEGAGVAAVEADATEPVAGVLAVVVGGVGGVDTLVVACAGVVLPEQPDSNNAHTPHVKTEILVNRMVILLHSSERGSGIRGGESALKARRHASHRPPSTRTTWPVT
jgi:hypothetical protein